MSSPFEESLASLLPSDQYGLIQELLRLSRKELKAKFISLESPELTEMDGEYRSVLLHQGSRLANVVIRTSLNLRVTYVGKAFQPVGGNEGLGYNVFCSRRGVGRGKPMRTRVCKSELAQGDSYLLEYRGMTRGPAAAMVDELRRYGPGVYLGIAELRPRITQRFNITRKIFFALAGPVAEFQRDAA